MRRSSVSVPGAAAKVLIRPRSFIAIVLPSCNIPAPIVAIPEPCRIVVATVLFVTAVLSATALVRSSGKEGCMLGACHGDDQAGNAHSLAVGNAGVLNCAVTGKGNHGRIRYTSGRGLTHGYGRS